MAENPGLTLPGAPDGPVSLAYAIGLPPAEAIAYLQAKGYAITWGWRDMWEAAHAKAFTVAGVTQLDVLQDLREGLDQALRDGQTLKEFRDQVEPLLKRKGWWGRDAQTDTATGEVTGKPLTPRRLRTIFETNVQTAYSAGRYRQFLDNADDRPYWQYVAVMDSRTRPAHAALNGRTFRADDPFWDSFYPPNGFRCRCRVRALSAGDVKRRGIDLSAGAARLTETTVPVSKRPDAERVTVARYQYAPGKYVSPDPGWSYNPGRAALPPDLVEQKLREAFPTLPSGRQADIARGLRTPPKAPAP